MVNIVVLAFAVLSISFISEGKVFNRCELAQQLLKNKIPRPQISTWVCIARHESEYDTTKINHSSGDHGIFQISQLFWCSTGNEPGKACKKTCAMFRDDNISDDIGCIRRIYDEHQRLSGNGFNAWVVYRRNCLGDTSSYVHGCF